MNWYLAVLKNYVEFSGRARRTEYWMSVLFHLIAVVVLSVLDRLIFPDGQVYLTPAFVLLSIVPALAVTGRRLHDTGPNEYGDDPKHTSLVAA